MDERDKDARPRKGFKELIESRKASADTARNAPNVVRDRILASEARKAAARSEASTEYAATEKASKGKVPLPDTETKVAFARSGLILRMLTRTMIDADRLPKGVELRHVRELPTELRSREVAEALHHRYGFKRFNTDGAVDTEIVGGTETRPGPIVPRELQSSANLGMYMRSHFHESGYTETYGEDVKGREMIQTIVLIGDVHPESQTMMHGQIFRVGPEIFLIDLDQTSDHDYDMGNPYDALIRLLRTDVRDAGEFRDVAAMAEEPGNAADRDEILLILDEIANRKGIVTMGDDKVRETYERTVNANKEILRGMEMGRRLVAEGIEEGREEGAAEARRSNILRIAAKGTPPEGLDDLVATTSAENLNVLFDLVDEARTTGDWSVISGMCDEAAARNGARTRRR